jgi:hypothetical protein
MQVLSCDTYHVHRAWTSVRRVYFGENSTGTASSTILTPIPSFCNVLQQCSMIASTGVWKFQGLGPEDSWQSEMIDVTHDPPDHFISLEILLHEGLAPSGQERLDLMSLLAKHIVKLGQSFPVWRKIKRDVVFRTQPSAASGTSIEFSQPYLGLRHRLDSVGESDQGLDHFFHSHPFLLDLGVLLLEIQSGKNIETLEAQELGDWDNNPVQTLYNDYITALHIVSKPAFNKSVAKGCGAVIKACLMCDFLPADFNAKSSQFQDLVYDHIVLPLELQQALGFDEVLDAHDWEEEEDEIDRDIDEDDLLEEESGMKSNPIVFLNRSVEGSQNWHIFDDCPYEPAK